MKIWSLGALAMLALNLSIMPAFAETRRQEPAQASPNASRTRADVHKLIEQIATLPRGNSSAAKQQALFDRLIAMGPDAVPAIVSQMDDRRPLAVQAISLINKSPDAFEGMRHYGPELMVDALAAVLNQISGQHFGFIYNGASEQDRRATVAGWRRYVGTGAK
jgi:hypothetical protein